MSGLHCGHGRPDPGMCPHCMGFDIGPRGDVHVDFTRDEAHELAGVLLLWMAQDIPADQRRRLQAAFEALQEARAATRRSLPAPAKEDT